MSTVEENRLRRQAKRLGVSLVKSSAKKWKVENQMGYMIIDTDANGILAGSNFELTYDQVEEWLNEYESQKNVKNKRHEYIHDKLESKIIEVYGSVEAFSEAMEMSTNRIQSRLKGKIQFNYDEIMKSVKLLNLTAIELEECFFSDWVERNNKMHIQG